MRKSMKPSGSISAGNSFTDILKPLADIGSSYLIATAINEYTRAMVALELQKGKVMTAEAAFKKADEFLAAGKKTDRHTEKTEGRSEDTKD